MNNRKLLLIVIFLITFISLFSQDNQTENIKSSGFSYHGFSGGMFIHGGYAKGKVFDVEFPTGVIKQVEATGPVFGLGGNLGFYFGKHWRFGGEGYVTNTYYDNESRFRIGWGGVLAEFLIPCKKFIPYIGLTIGGGKYTNSYFPVKPNGTLATISAIYHQQSIFILTPYMGLEYAITEKLHFRFRMDYLTAPVAMIKESDFGTGIRFYAGILFCKW